MAYPKIESRLTSQCGLYAARLIVETMIREISDNCVMAMADKTIELAAGSIAENTHLRK